MKKIHLASILLAVLGWSMMFTSCENLKTMVKNHPTMAKYEVKPNPLEMRGDKIKVELKGEYQPKYFNTNAIVVLQPGIQYEGGTQWLKPIILRGEKTKGQGNLISKTKGGNFTYTDEVAYVPAMEQCQLIFNPVAYVEKKAKNMNVTNEEEALKVSKNVRLGETIPAKGTMITSTRINKLEAAVSTESDKYEKETVITKQANIYFLVDTYNLNWGLPLNKAEKNKTDLKNLDAALESGMLIKSIKIAAWASPEGEESRNQNLSENRATTGNKYFQNAYDRIVKAMAKKLKVKKDSLKQNITPEILSKGEDWEGFIADLRASDIPEKNTIINVISSHADRTAREQEIRNMTVIYKQIEDNILPSLRRAEITIDFLEPKKTDEQIAEFSLTAPDSLSLEELLYAVTLTDNKENQLQIYLSATRIYPDDFRAFLNASALYIGEGNYEEAQKLLETANAMQPNNANVLNNLGVVALSKGDFENARSNFKSAAAASPQASSNLGILDIKDGNYAQAASSLSAVACQYNLALAQLLNAEVDKAKATLDCMNPLTPDAYYLKAVCAARAGDKAGVIEAMRKAIAEKPALKVQAQKDIEFIKMKDDAEFQSILR
ncbi:MAG: tetratricopeptide repeat protein [Bacteroidales bacterium]